MYLTNFIQHSLLFGPFFFFHFMNREYNKLNLSSSGKTNTVKINVTPNTTHAI